ncbi:MAG: hypothetical protein CMJ89_04845 [Planctomycetes bacterium]|nr:hypothetical protein [Planctomycetota bacterium]
MSGARIRFRLNGEEVALEVHPLRRLLDCVRDDLGRTGTKEGCGEGECGACTVLVDGVAVNSCIAPVGQVVGCDVTTIEGTGHGAIQEAFVVEGGAQCGICTPGLILMTRAWLEECERRGEEPSEARARKALAGNLCRCTGYGKVLASALAAHANSRSGRNP